MPDHYKFSQDSRSEYFPFGELAFGTHADYTQQRYRFAGKERDEDHGLSYFGARYYAPWTCRFTSVDPLKGESPGLAPYHYSSNNPMNRIDPTGMQDDSAGDGGTETISVDNQIYLGNEGKPLDDVVIMGERITGVDPLPSQTVSQDALSSYPSNQEPFSRDIVSKPTPGLTLEQASTQIGLGTLESSRTKSQYMSYINRSKELKTQDFTNSKMAIGIGSSAISAYKDVLTGGGRSWLGKNFKYYNSSWGGNQWTGARSSVMNNVKALKIGARFTFAIGAFISLFEGVSSYSRGDTTGSLKAGLDLSMASVGFIPIVGTFASATYFAVDATIGWGNALEAHDKMTKETQSILGSGWNSMRMEGGLR